MKAATWLTLAENEARYILATVEIAGGCISEAPRLLGLHRRTLQRKLTKIGYRRKGRR